MNLKEVEWGYREKENKTFTVIGWNSSRVYCPNSDLKKSYFSYSVLPKLHASPSILLCCKFFISLASYDKLYLDDNSDKTVNFLIIL